ncbi:uncharacterized protein LY89DRAFT_394756 [Mollisia scopiformis]|uniref:DUF7702 domain-containing protein n=1 Tax=Mollisia scopiformis TaxID=149040 RepID=A0A194XPZ7_MOLSC|nr:uncharacterized protein LY89DRAFT_394756 [Mollisia scopiformis]KUJ22129.1 hypothetical protein LY89DRAFT_394756 [Mollisia scopiformis]
MTLTYRNDVSIAELVFYIPSLFVAIYLAITHGFRRNSGWIYLILFCLARIIGPIMQLATIKNPDSVSLYTGSAILNSIGISPLEIATLGFLSRLLDSIHKSYNTFLHPRMLQLVQLIIVIGLILGIVGGIDAGNNFQSTGQYHPGTLNKAGTSLLIVSYVAIVIFTILIAFFVKHAEAGERRLFVAVAIALPFLLVRIVYSGLSTFSRNSRYNILTGNTTIFLCVALIEEAIIVFIFEVMGVTLKKQVKEQHVEAQAARQVDSSNSAQPMQPKKEHMALSIAKKTIIGRIVMAIIGSGKKEERNTEMQQPAR